MVDLHPTQKVAKAARINKIDRRAKVETVDF
jgi:hypothetical protein